MEKLLDAFNRIGASKDFGNYQEATELGIDEHDIHIFPGSPTSLHYPV